MIKKILPCIILAMLAMIVLLSAGCIGGDYVANRDIVIIRLGPDGATEWTRSIDTGYDDSASDFIQTADGGFLIGAQNTSGRYGPSHSRLLRLSADGQDLRVYPLAQNYGELTSLIQTRDGGFAAIAREGEVIRAGPFGNLLWETSTGLTSAMTILETAGGSIAVAGVQQDSIPFGQVPVYDQNGTVSSRPPLPGEVQVTPGCHETHIPAGDRQIAVTECTVPVDLIQQAAVVVLDAGGNLSWKKSYGATGTTSAWSMKEAPDGKGFLAVGFETLRNEGVNRTNYIVALDLERNGTVLHATRFDRIEYFTAAHIRTAPGGYDILYTNTTIEDGHYANRPAQVHFDAGTGNVTFNHLLDAGVVVTWTGDGGYFTAVFDGYSEDVYARSDTHRLHAVYLNPDGSRAWDREIPKVTVNYIEKVIQTSDGGYAILALKENY
jgi:hypothetical protein